MFNLLRKGFKRMSAHLFIFPLCAQYNKLVFIVEPNRVVVSLSIISDTPIIN